MAYREDFQNLTPRTVLTLHFSLHISQEATYIFKLLANLLLSHD